MPAHRRPVAISLRLEPGGIIIGPLATVVEPVKDVPHSIGNVLHVMIVQGTMVAFLRSVVLT
jgi:hypothetical protein